MCKCSEKLETSGEMKQPGQSQFRRFESFRHIRKSYLYTSNLYKKCLLLSSNNNDNNKHFFV